MSVTRRHRNGSFGNSVRMFWGIVLSGATIAVMALQDLALGTAAKAPAHSPLYWIWLRRWSVRWSGGQARDGAWNGAIRTQPARCGREAAGRAASIDNKHQVRIVHRLHVEPLRLRQRSSLPPRAAL